MTHPVENMESWERGVARDELPYHEALCRLYELRDRYDNPSATGMVGSASARHLEATGHRLAFGCCADHNSIMAALGREERRMLRALELEQAS